MKETIYLFLLLSIVGTTQNQPQSLGFTINSPIAQDDYGQLLSIPDSFGIGEFTFQMWIKPDTTFPVGPTGSGTSQVTNWYDGDDPLYGFGGWWFPGNFLLDGHNNGSFNQGTFSLQFYGGGRVRWHFGDGTSVYLSDPWVIQAIPATSVPTLLDGSWHLLSCIRRWVGADSSALELWVDDYLVADTTSELRTNMRTYWDTWSGWPQGGWFFGAEKQAAEDLGPIQYEDYKGLIDEVRLYARAKSSNEITNDFTEKGCENNVALKGRYDMSEGPSAKVTNQINNLDTIFLFSLYSGAWAQENAPCACEALSGVYYIDQTISSNDSTFNTFDSAITRLTACGMQDSVTLKVKNGTGEYLESLVIGDIPGNHDLVPLIINANGETIKQPNMGGLPYVIWVKPGAVVLLKNIGIED